MALGHTTSGFHQRKPSLTSACPPVSTVPPKDKKQLAKRPWHIRWPVLRLIAYCYVLFSVGVATVHLFSLYQQIYPSSAADALFPLHSAANASLNDIPHSLWLSKIFNKAGPKFDHIRPYWFSCSEITDAETLSLATVLTPEDWPHLAELASLWRGPISATLQIPSSSVNATIEQLERLRQAYDADEYLSKYVDIHLVIRPHVTPAWSLGGRQEARNLARLFSRTEFVAHLPVKTRYLTDLSQAVQEYESLLRNGDVLVVPSFVNRGNNNNNLGGPWPEDKIALISLVDQGKMGLQDYHWRLNEGPTSYMEWRMATEPYLVTEYDYHYGPTYIATRNRHPWCEERFEDQLSACVYSMFLAGADLWVLPEDYIIREIEPEYALTSEEQAMQDRAYKNYRIELCVFYARQFNLDQLLDEDRASHIKQECAKVLGSLRKAKMIDEDK
ncbi:hypothetical protein EC973_000556 [Apophysomyces ossiformis]|uniref:Glycosyltransferase family 49 protein n=1 Tax=Apophysomyces ossiformis TaxID=679940 RepID=A0A8H7BR41_9FUNG|nr:hypothetical protein EC973_000556 [Apophysomyces ossiformis]